MSDQCEAGIWTFRPAATPNKRKKITHATPKQPEPPANATRCDATPRTNPAGNFSAKIPRTDYLIKG
jgi:hypothetical protein